MKEVISEILMPLIKKQGLSIKKEEIEQLIETPPSVDMGDYAFPCFYIASKIKLNPSEVALNLRADIKKIPEEFEDIQTQGPYLNFFLNRKKEVLSIVSDILFSKEPYGKFNSDYAGKTTMVEFPSPNTNKPLHLGHLRNITIGESISRISEFAGEHVIRANLNNDRGIHICKSMAAYSFFGKDKKPDTKKQKSDHFVGDFYVMFNKNLEKNPGLELESQKLLQKWEEGDKKTLALWKKMNKWALDGFKETYKKFQVKHDVEFFESEIYKNGKDIVLQGVKDKIFTKKEDGSIIADLKEQGFGEKVLLRSDGTSIYMTQDLYLAKLKKKSYKVDKSIYVVGNEQNHHFQILFTLLNKLGFNTNDLKHLSYGLVNLPEGRMKSREGTIVDADDLIEEIQKLVKKELKSRGKLSEKQLEEKSLNITLAAIKYILLRVDTKKDMTFNPKESIDFEGETGPYLLYSYARACSILSKLKNTDISSNQELKEVEIKEVELAKKLSDFKTIVKKAFDELNPSIIANYSYQLSKIFNEFYHTCPVVGSEKQSFRVSLVTSFKKILGDSLLLMGIQPMEKM